MLNFVICDDDHNMLNKLSILFEKAFIRNDFNGKIVLKTSNYKDVISFMNSNTVNVLVLDIEFKNSNLLRKRTITFKFENIYNETIKSITINGKDVPFTIFSPNKNTFPLSSKNNETIVFKFNERLDKRSIIKINVN